MNDILRIEKRPLLIASFAVILTSLLNLGAPVVLAHAIDYPLAAGDYPGVLRYGLLLIVMGTLAMGTQYAQTLLMGGVGQRTVYRLRGELFDKLQDLPLSFFQTHQTGDLISRIANDTEKLAQFFSQSLVRFVGSLVTMVGAALFLIGLNPRLGGAALMPAVGIFLLTRLLTPLIRSTNKASLESMGELSGEVSESLENFKVIVAFDRRDYFRKHFQQVNLHNYRQSLKAGLVNGFMSPLYGLCSQLGQLIVLAYGLLLISQNQFTVGLLISYFVYLNRFYDPLRQLAALWATFQAAMSGYDRIAEILAVTDHLRVLPGEQPDQEAPRMEFQAVSFGYHAEKCVLHHVSFRLEAGRTYAFVGPTGGGKTTTASLMARLFDPNDGVVKLNGCDLRTYSLEERSTRIGFILQDPFLFEGTVGDNVTSLEGFDHMFEAGLQTPVAGLSLGQKQVVAFLRAVLRRPEILILDEATANIDTVTEKALAELLDRLPETTTRVIIAHRLNTIENADVIYFVNAGHVTRAGSMEQAVSMLREEHRVS